jgi:hypothetical protein
MDLITLSEQNFTNLNIIVTEKKFLQSQLAFQNIRYLTSFLIDHYDYFSVIGLSIYSPQ